jgi:hypothetical protein
MNEDVHLLQFECNAPISIHDLSKVWKPFVIYLYCFVVNIFVSLLISFLIYENDLDHIIYDDTTNCTIQINNMLDDNLKTI